MTAPANARIGCGLPMGRDHVDEGWRAGRRLARETADPRGRWEGKAAGGRVKFGCARPLLGPIRALGSLCWAESLKGPVGAARTPPPWLRARLHAPAGFGDLPPRPSCHGDGGRLREKRLRSFREDTCPRARWDCSQPAANLGGDVTVYRLHLGSPVPRSAWPRCELPRRLGFPPVQWGAGIPAQHRGLGSEAGLEAFGKRLWDRKAARTP